MSSLSMEDMSGKPRSDGDLQDAITACKTIMLKHALVLPLFTVHAGIIINCLEELQVLRKLLKDARAKRNEAKDERQD